MENVAQDDTQMAASGNAPDQPPLFPEDVDSNGQNDLAQKLTALPPEELAAVAQAIDPDVKLNFVQAIFSTMTPEQKQQVDVVPSKDVDDAMANATPEKPEMMYQMSVIRSQKKCQATPGMETLALDHLDKWNQRLDSLIEDGYVGEKEAAQYRKDLDKAGENRFSIILEKHGLLRDTCNAIVTLEKSRAAGASLSKSVIQGAQSRFSTARPIKRQADPEPNSFDMKEAEAAGERLAKMS